MDKKYSVKVTVSIPAVVKVKASSLAEAQDKAIKQAQRALVLFPEDSNIKMTKEEFLSIC